MSSLLCGLQVGRDALPLTVAADPVVRIQGRVVEEMDVGEATEQRIMYAAVH